MRSPSGVRFCMGGSIPGGGTSLRATLPGRSEGLYRGLREARALKIELRTIGFALANGAIWAEQTAGVDVKRT
jgi:hypothetical protein